jgi:hypothetical protein
MRGCLLLTAILALAACDRPNNGKTYITSTGAELLASSPAVSARVAPLTLPLVRVASPACAIGPAFSTSFDLIFVSVPDSAFFVDRVTIRLNDGTVLGSPLTFPRADLNAMFGSTLVAGTRAFPFRPVFDCGFRSPLSLLVDVTLINSGGSVQSVSTTARF